MSVFNFGNYPESMMNYMYKYNFKVPKADLYVLENKKMIEYFNSNFIQTVAYSNYEDNYGFSAKFLLKNIEGVNLDIDITANIFNLFSEYLKITINKDPLMIPIPYLDADYAFKKDEKMYITYADGHIIHIHLDLTEAGKAELYLLNTLDGDRYSYI